MATPFLKQLVSIPVAIIIAIGLTQHGFASPHAPEPDQDFPPLETLIHPESASNQTLPNNPPHQKQPLNAEKPAQPTQSHPVSTRAESDSLGVTENTPAPTTTLQSEPAGPPAKMTTVYTELPGILVLPIIPPTGNRAFHDSSVMMANSLAEELGQKLSNTLVHQPYYTLQNLHYQGFDRMYKQLNDEYFQSGSPSPTLTQYLLDKLQPNAATPEIHRVIFVQSNVNMMQPDKSYHIMDVFNRLVNESPPNTARYFLETRVKVYDSTSPHLTLIWQGRWNEPVKADRLGNISLSIFDSADARDAFQKASNRISTVIMLRAPKESYMQANLQPVITATRVNAKTLFSH